MPSMAALPTFADGTVPHAADFNGLAADVDTLCQITTGRATTAVPPVFSKPAAKVYLSTSVPVANATNTLPPWDTVAFDTNSMFNLETNGQMLVHVPGWYRIEAQAAWASGPAGDRTIQILVNGSAIPANTVSAVTTTMGAAANNQRSQVCAYEHLAANASVLVSVFQSSGGSLNLLNSATWGTWFSLIWDAPY